ncbi:hypothetical protein FPOAC1_002469 [Fusarium poae]|uniref:hypothetical protein n=1 Tax=Fusarium poae TaxID=36050 RepID=UPI001CEBF066|nr:hypothetical protein FPOAC1_002469 [Fusarium poae]KAG8676465.1 hypothetical protein FPOAC1_002469 [Fusarium poae]
MRALPYSILIHHGQGTINSFRGKNCEFDRKSVLAIFQDYMYQYVRGTSQRAALDITLFIPQQVWKQLGYPAIMLAWA